jgi:hypothetical protein
LFVIYLKISPCTRNALANWVLKMCGDCRDLLGLLCGWPQIDPAILLHRDPHAWEELLGWGCIEAFLERARFVGVDSLDSLVDYSVSSPSAMRLVLAGVRFSGRYGREWVGICAAGWRWARMKFPKVETGVRRDDVWIQTSPAYMLLPFDETKRTWQKTAHTLTTKPRLTCRPEAELCEEKRRQRNSHRQRSRRKRPGSGQRGRGVEGRSRPDAGFRDAGRRGGCLSRGVS